jgi:hypothetical protein
MDRKFLFDRGGRRSGIDRRRFSYALHIPEHRHSKDRRKNPDRRDKQTEYMTPIKEKEAQKEIGVY